MSLSQMQVFNKYVMPATIETLSQMVEKFNAASGGAIRLTTEASKAISFRNRSTPLSTRLSAVLTVTRPRQRLRLPT